MAHKVILMFANAIDRQGFVEIFQIVSIILWVWCELGLWVANLDHFFSNWVNHPMSKMRPWAMNGQSRPEASYLSRIIIQSLYSILGFTWIRILFCNKLANINRTMAASSSLYSLFSLYAVHRMMMCIGRATSTIIK